MNQELKEELQITDEEAQLLQEALEAYLQYKNIETANPANAFFLQVTMITLRLTITSIKRGAEEKAYWNQIFKKAGSYYGSAFFMDILYIDAYEAQSRFVTSAEAVEKVR